MPNVVEDVVRSQQTSFISVTKSNKMYLAFTLDRFFFFTLVVAAHAATDVDPNAAERLSLCASTGNCLLQKLVCCGFSVNHCLKYIITEIQ